MYQIDSLGNIFIVKPAKSEVVADSDPLSDQSFDGLPKVTFSFSSQKELQDLVYTNDTESSQRPLYADADN